MPSTSEKQLHEAIELHQAGDLSSARKIYQALLVDDSSNSQVLNLLGLLHAQLEEYDLAILYFQEALSQENSALYANNLGNAFKAFGDKQKAEEHYRLALSIKPDYSEAHNNLANLLMQKHQLNEALQHYYQAVRLQPDYIVAHHNLGLLFMKLGNLDAARTQFLNVLKLHPNSINAHYHLANIYLGSDNLDLASFHYEAVLQLDPTHLDSLNNLGALQIKMGQEQTAVQYFLNVLTLDENNLQALANLGNLYLHHRRYLPAISYLEKLLLLQPNDLETHYNLAVAYMGEGKVQQAIDHYETILRHNPKHAASLSNVGAIYLSQGKHQSAIDYFREALLLEPDNVIVKHMFNALIGKQEFTAAPLAYVKNLFDSYATHYDRQLNEILQYQIPKLLKQLVEKTFSDKNLIELNILDLGCGTGMAADYWRYAAKRLVGVDISSQMLKTAENKNLYDELIESDILNFLYKKSEIFDMIIAADVLIYFGDLAEIFSLCYEHLTPEGLFIFSVEQSIADNFKLLPSARYAHSLSYIQSLAVSNQLIVVNWELVTGRQQAHQDVAEYIFILMRK